MQPGGQLTAKHRVAIQAELLQAHAMQPRSTPDRQQQLVGNHLPTGGLQRHGATVHATQSGVLGVGTPAGRHLGPEPHIDPGPAERPKDDFPGERLLPLEQSVPAEVGEVRLRARHAVGIATGSEPIVPELYAAALPWGSRDATGVVDVPPRLAIVGGGVVACEAATWLAGLGSRVTLLVSTSRSPISRPRPRSTSTPTERAQST